MLFAIAEMIYRNKFDQLDNACVAFEEFLTNTLHASEGKLDFTLKRLKDQVIKELQERAQNLSESLQQGSEGLPAMTTERANEAAAVFYTPLAKDRKGEVLTFDPKQRRKRPK